MKGHHNSGLDFSMLASYFPTNSEHRSFDSFPTIGSNTSRDFSNQSTLTRKTKGKYERLDAVRAILHHPSIDLTSLTLCEECSITMKKESQNMLLRLHNKLERYTNFYNLAAATSSRQHASKTGSSSSPVKSRSPNRKTAATGTPGVSFVPSIHDDEDIQRMEQELQRLQRQEEALKQTIDRYEQEVSVIGDSAAQLLDERGAEIADAEAELEEEIYTANAVLNELLVLDANIIISHLERERALLGLTSNASHHLHPYTSAHTSSSPSSATSVFLSPFAPAFDHLNIQHEWSDINGLRLRCHALPAIQLNWIEINRAWSVATTWLAMLRHAHHLPDDIHMNSLLPLHREILRCYPTLALLNDYHHHNFSHNNNHYNSNAPEFLSMNMPGVTPSSAMSPFAHVFTWTVRMVPLHDRALLQVTLTPPAASAYTAATGSHHNSHHHNPHYPSHDNTNYSSTSGQHTSSNSSNSKKSVMKMSIVLEGGIPAQRSEMASLLTQYQRAVIWWCVSVVVMKVEIDGIRAVLFNAPTLQQPLAAAAPSSSSSTSSLSADGTSATSWNNESCQQQQHQQSRGSSSGSSGGGGQIVQGLQSIALWELLLTVALGRPLGIETDPFTLPLAAQQSPPSMDEINNFLAYLPIPRHESELPEKLQVMIQFQHRFGIPATIWKILRVPSYLDTLLMATMRVFRDLTERSLPHRSSK